MSEKKTKTLPWWKTTTVYQIYPRSFKDSTGNGIGDIPGIISKLDYLQDLGIETIWFSPFFASPQADYGYDVSDYRGIAPEYGTMADCEQLIEEVHSRNMYIVFDLVLNHTSDQHPWFLESRSNRDNPKRDWYIWRDGKKPGGKKPPNNWKAIIGGSGWHYDDMTNQWYWAQFLPFQPDLNYRNPEVKEEMFDTIRFWLNKGVDGYRLDIINTIYEDKKLRDNPFTWRLFPSEHDDKSLFQNRIHTINHPDNFEFVKELRSIMNEYSNPERFLIGEISASLETLKRYCGESVDEASTNGLHLTFHFQSLETNFDANEFRDLILGYDQYFIEPYTPTWVFSNHDIMRRISKLGNNVVKAKLNATLQLTARGVPFIYYGEEIGMLNHRIPLEAGQDPIAKRSSKFQEFLIKALMRNSPLLLNRDNCRTPMQWSSSPNAGFCSTDTEPWLPLEPGYEIINVETEELDTDSLLQCYKALLKLRKETPALHSGSIHVPPKPAHRKALLTFERTHNKQGVEVWLNFSNSMIQVSRDDVCDKFTLLFSTDNNSNPFHPSGIQLAPYQGIVIERKANES